MYASPNNKKHAPNKKQDGRTFRQDTSPQGRDAEEKGTKEDEKFAYQKVEEKGQRWIVERARRELCYPRQEDDIS